MRAGRGRGALLCGALVAAHLGVTARPAAAEVLVPVAAVNFQSDGAAVPAGYARDVGQAFDSARGYGWVAMSSSTPLSLVGNGRERNVEAVAQPERGAGEEGLVDRLELEPRHGPRL